MHLNLRSKLVLASALVLVAAGLIVATDSVQAAISQALPAQGKVIVCNGTKDHELQLPGGPDFGVQTAGPLTIKVGQQFQTPDGRAGVHLDVIDIQSSGSAQGLGPASFSLDSARGGSGTYTAHQKSSAFPGTQRLSFHLVLRTGGREYRSINAATLVSTNVGSLPPAKGTVYTLANEVQLEDITDPGKVAGALAPGQAASIR